MRRSVFTVVLALAGDTATLRDPRRVVQTCAWRTTGRGWITC